jgi:RHS repeat-associated protein
MGNARLFGERRSTVRSVITTGSDRSRKAATASSTRPPDISLPQGGGAIRGIGEKFTSNAVTGTGSLSVPIACSPGRSGFGPQLSLNYDSGAGNGPFGFGWALGLPQITRKTDKGLPQYQDSQESDVFILSGAEDLVPVLVEQDGMWIRETLRDRAITDGTYTVQRYRPRIEGLFARIERWTRHTDGDVHWRSISRDNVLTLYGKDANSRITDPVDPRRIFTWLICETRDDRGNAVLYEYKAEDGAGVDLTRAHERNRGDRHDPRRAVNRYPKRIRYGNRKTLLDNAGQRPPVLSAAERQNAGWMFEVVFDYGEHAGDAPTPHDTSQWKYRGDPFSSYRAGFEIRTGRLCQRVLMFHHFPDEAGVGADCLVRSTDFTYSHQQDLASVRNPAYTYLRQVSQSGYKRNDGGYLKRSLPPVEFEYTRPNVQDTVQEIDAQSLQNLPMGVDGASYLWTDLYGEGIPGILTEQAGAWFYKRNLSPISEHPVEFAAVERVAAQPNLTLAGGDAQFMDLAGDGQPDLVVLDGPLPGLYEQDQDEGWRPFRPFTSRLNRDLRNANSRFVDLDGDGHADLLFSEDDAFVWHASLAENGFGPARHIPQALDEKDGPRLVFADGTESVYLADLDGDGLTDLVRIRNGDVCYWPNLGYGRFGAKVTMDGAPRFDHLDQFDHKRIRLADVDGSGTTDIIYLHRDGVRLYFNQSGNSWSEPNHLDVFPRIDDLASIVPVDLFGNGTACLVWSSPLPGDARRSLRYVDLMGGQKPHLLVKSSNNLGAETVVSYAPSTRFYLADKAAGSPWLTKLPFPVHCVEKVTVNDKWRRTSFSSTYSYHHGYFDGDEREFRGFGRIEQLDVESYGEFLQGNPASPYITDDKTLYQPPVKTVTWYHTGALLNREHILSQYADEYFPRWFEDSHPGAVSVLGDFRELTPPEPDLAAEDLSAQEWREALRACKGLMLRQEAYELDVDALERGEHRPVKLFASASRNCHIRRLQAQVTNRHAVFLVAESESITYHYELDLRPDLLRPDPRIAHTLNLQFDQYANVLQSVAAVYPRLGRFEDQALPGDALSLVRRVQEESHLAYSETRFTNDVAEADNLRLRVPCETLTYELTGIGPADADDQHTRDPRDHRYFTLDELRRFRLSLVHQTLGKPVPEISYHQLATGSTPEKRLIEHKRVLFFNDDSVVVDRALPFGQRGRLGLEYETYTLALTNELLGTVFDDKITPDVLTRLGDPSDSGYLSGAALAAAFAGTDGQYWIRSGIAGFAPDAALHFYLPERFSDAFGHVTVVEYDPLDLFLSSSSDALGNTTRVMRFDYRVLAASEMRDMNGNLSEVFFDVLGLPTAMAAKGKGHEGDSLAGFDDALANPETSDLEAFFDQSDLDEIQTRAWLAGASARHVYYFGEQRDAEGVIAWGVHPACGCGIVREMHVSQLAPGEDSPLRTAFEYSDGLGSVVVKIVQADPGAPGQPRRWIASGKTILNNKGQPVKQYEPYFSPSGHRFEESIDIGVTAVVYYDALGRVIRTELPDGTLSRVTLSPWFVRSFDANDTVRESEWSQERSPPEPLQPLPRDLLGRLLVTEDQRAAWLAAKHAGTPALTVLDSLGREVIGIAHNRVRDPAGGRVFGGESWRDEYHVNFTKLDAEGRPLWIRDARGNLVMQYIWPPVPDSQPDDPVAGFAPCYDIAGHLLFQRSMDGGERWILNDSAGKPMLAWNSRGHAFRSQYDELQRPVASFVTGADPEDADREIQFDHVVYGDTPNNGLSEAQKSSLNLRGKPYKHRDTAGLVVNLGRHPGSGEDESFDFKGNLLRSTRQLVQDFRRTPDWSHAPALESETFSSATRFDALNRPVQFVAPYSDRPGTRLNVIRAGYNQAGLPERLDLWLEQATEPVALLNAGTANQHVISHIQYNAKGQRTRIRYGNGASTTYDYDPRSFRLTRLLTDRGAAFAGDWPEPPDPPRGGIQNLSYFYDPVGNITHIRDDAQQTIVFSGQRIEPSASYEYDAIYRLITATGREHIGQQAAPQVSHELPRINQPLPTETAALRNYTERYDYDPVGNILRMIHEAGTTGSWRRGYEYEATSNRLRATSLPGDADAVFSATYEYDEHGNLTRMPHLPLMQWNCLDRLQASARQVISSGSPETTWYVYDAGGQRVRKVTERQAPAGETPSRMQDRIYVGDCEVYREYGNHGDNVTLERETLHLIDDEQRVALVETTTVDVSAPPGAPAALVRYQFGNHLGSASLELDEAGLIISYEEFHPYGTTSYQAGRSAAEVSLKRYRYTGMERDSENGLSYHRERYYAPWLGRWSSCDPKGLVDGTCRYCYVKNSPVMGSDPTGLETKVAGFGREIGPPQADIDDFFAEIRKQLGLPPSRPATRLNPRIGFKNPSSEINDWFADIRKQLGLPSASTPEPKTGFKPPSKITPTASSTPLEKGIGFTRKPTGPRPPAPPPPPPPPEPVYLKKPLIGPGRSPVAPPPIAPPATSGGSSQTTSGSGTNNTGGGKSFGWGPAIVSIVLSLGVAGLTSDSAEEFLGNAAVGFLVTRAPALGGITGKDEGSALAGLVVTRYVAPVAFRHVVRPLVTHPLALPVAGTVGVGYLLFMDKEMMVDQERADRDNKAFEAGHNVNSFCNQCHGKGGALDPNNKWNLKARYGWTKNQ